MTKFVKKGALVGVEGRLNQRTFTRQDGSKGTAFEVLCDSVQFLEPKGNVAQGAGNEANDIAQPEPVEANNESLDVPDDDLPW